ncbi:MAG: HD domain-containing protein [Lachnospiraceae bacterium]
MDREEKRSREQFWDTFIKLRENPSIQELKKYPNHKISNLYDHSSRVAICAYHLAKRMHLDVNEKSLAKGAMLHDFYLYHARGNRDISVKEHWFGHPMTALENAEKEFQLTELEKNIITSHMWPLTFLHFPKSREALLVSLADKICAFGEMFLKRNHVKALKKAEI